MSQPSSAAGQPPSFKTNVNRAKTKRWVEAKSYSYDGDDWGDVDDYDEYGGYEEPVPATKPTGLRQRGQSATSQHPPEIYTASTDQGRNTGIESRPHHLPQTSAGRNFTSPPISYQHGLRRQNSFDPEEERRAFSGPQTIPPQNSGPERPLAPASTPVASGSAHPHQSGSSVQPYVHQPPQAPSHMPFRPIPDETSHFPGHGQHPAGDGRGSPFAHQGPPSGTGSRAQSMTTNNAAQDFHNRRDFTQPSAVPPPLQMRASPAAHAPDQWHPPRKSSLGQDNAPPPSILPQTAMVTSPAENVTTGRSTRERAASGPDKVLPFVRPADIYRRMEEEKERARRSQESSRPSLDSMTGRPKDIPKIDTGRDMESELWGKATLNPVKERQSDLFPEPVKSEPETSSQRSSQQTLKKPSNQPESHRDSLQGVQKQSGTPSEQRNLHPTRETFSMPESLEKKATTSKKFDLQQPQGTTANRPPLGPMLPELSRVSGFGESFGEAFMVPSSGFGDFSVAESAPNTVAPETVGTTAEKSRTDLQHQPSLGFTSAVHQSFDRAQEQVPPTPSSVADSSVQRSTSGGTSTISPIISRGPSAATHGMGQPLPGIADVATPVQEPDEPSETNGGPISVDSLATPTQTQIKPAYNQTLAESPPPSFIPGHRRDMSTPSPDNSPAKLPAVEVNRQLRRPQEIELATATPTPTDTDRESDLDTEDQPRKSTISPSKSDITIKPPTVLTNQRQTSPERGKVRTMAERFEGSRSNSPHLFPRNSPVEAEKPQSDSEVSSRPRNERLESFRPQLPGGWESSYSVMPSNAQTQGGTASGKQNESAPGELFNNMQPGVKDSKVNDDASASEPQSIPSQVKDVTKDAFAAAASAGSALAGALAAAVSGDARSDSEKDESPIRGHPERSATRAHGEAIEPFSHPQQTDIPAPLAVDSKTPSTVPSPSPLLRGPSSQVEPSPSHPNQALPAISTDVKSHQYESDRLRREIVRELSPNGASEPTTAGSDSPYQASSRYSTNRSAPPSGLESGTVPRDNDNYWNDYIGGHGPHLSGVADQASLEGRAELHHDISDAQSQASEPERINDQTRSQIPIAPAETTETMAEPPHHLSHRFSWEQPLQELGPQQGAPRISSNPPVPEPSNRSLEQQPSQSVPQEPLSEDPDTARSSTVVETSTIGVSDSIRKPPKLDHLVIESAPETRSFLGESEQEKSSQNYSTGLEVAPALLEKREDVSSISGPGESPSTRGSPGQGPAPMYAETSSPQDNQFTHTTSNQESQPAPQSVPQPLLQPSPNAPPVQSQQKIPPFREILALKSPAERIRTYNQTRYQFANQDTGLSQWLASTINDLPENADLVASQGRVTFPGNKNSPSRSKFGVASSGQESVGGSASQTFSTPGGSGGKISSQQVQAKSKELLHSAGIFGGKANVAAKGLFSKGKNRFRSSGGIDKAPSPASAPVSPDPVSQGMQDARPPAANFPRSPAQQDDVAHQDLSPFQVQSADARRQPSESTHDSERGSASLNSYSQGQLGDDERSEGSVKSTGPTASPPRHDSSLTGSDHSLNGQASQENRRLANLYTTFGSRNPGRPESDSTTPTGRRSPRSTKSGGPPNDSRTPTQASFDMGDRDSRTRVQGTGSSTRNSVPDASSAVPAVPAAERIGSIGARRSPTASAARSRSRSSPRSQRSQRALSQELPLTQPPQSNTSPTPSPNLISLPPQSRDSLNRGVPSAPAPPPAPPPAPAPAAASRHSSSPTSQPPRSTARQVRSPSAVMPLTDARVKSDRSRHLSLSHPQPGFANTSYLEPPSPQPSPLFDEPTTRLNTPKGAHERGVSIASIPSTLGPDRPVSPISPSYAASTAAERQGRTIIPVHHGIDHDFTTDGGAERARRRHTPQSSTESRAAPAPDLQSHPAYRPSSESTHGTELLAPVNFHPALASSGDAAMRPGSTPQYQLDQMGAPDLPPVDEKPRSRRASRSSAFFKSSNDSPSRRSQRSKRDASNNRLSRNSRHLEDDTKSKRSSIFGLINTRSNSGSGNEHVKAKDQIPRSSVEPSQNISTTVNTPASRSQHTSLSAKLTKKLQRASTGGASEPEGGRKNRLSLGGLFSRSNQKKTPPTQRAVGPQGQYLQYNAPQPTPGRFPLDEEPEGANPPIEGYFAPGRKQRARPQMPRQSDVSAYVQDSSYRQLQTPVQGQIDPRRPPPHNQQPAETTPSRTIAQQNSTPASSNARSSNKDTSPANLRRDQTPPNDRPSGSWARFSSSHTQTQRKSPKAAPAPNQGVTLSHISDFIAAPSKTGSGRSHRSRIEGTTSPPSTQTLGPQKSQLDSRSPQLRSISPPPPPPPPKDEWLRPKSNHTRSTSQPFDTAASNSFAPITQATNKTATGARDRRTLPINTNIAPSNTVAADNIQPLSDTATMSSRPYLPPIQTDVPSPTLRMNAWFSERNSGSLSGSTSRRSRFGGSGATAPAAANTTTYPPPSDNAVASTADTTAYPPPPSTTIAPTSNTTRGTTGPTATMSLKEKRRSRQDEIEKGHLTASAPTRAVSSPGQHHHSRRIEGATLPPSLPPLPTSTSTVPATATATAPAPPAAIAPSLAAATATTTNREPSQIRAIAEPYATPTGPQRSTAPSLTPATTTPPPPSITRESEAPEVYQGSVDSSHVHPDPKLHLQTQTQTGTGPVDPVGGGVGESEDEKIVMSATSFPGQEWQPPEYLHWEGD